MKTPPGRIGRCLARGVPPIGSAGLGLPIVVGRQRLAAMYSAIQDPGGRGRQWESVTMDVVGDIEEVLAGDKLAREVGTPRVALAARGEGQRLAEATDGGIAFGGLRPRPRSRTRRPRSSRR